MGKTRTKILGLSGATRRSLRKLGMSEEEISLMETSVMSSRDNIVGLDPDDFDRTYDHEVRQAIRELINNTK